MPAAQQEPLYVRRSLRVASMTPAKFGDDLQNTNRSRGDSPSRRPQRPAVEETPIAGGGQQRRATAVDLSVGRGGFNNIRTPGNQYGRTYDLSDPFSASLTPFNRPFLNLDIQDGGGQVENTPSRPMELDYPPSRDRQVLNLPSSADNILAETPSRFAFLPSLSRFTPFLTPKVHNVLEDAESNTPNIAATVKARRKSTTPRGKSHSPSSPVKERASPKKSFSASISRLARLFGFLYNSTDLYNVILCSGCLVGQNVIVHFHGSKVCGRVCFDAFFWSG